MGKGKYRQKVKLKNTIPTNTKVKIGNELNQDLSFSFKFYDTNDSKYCLSSWDQLNIKQTLLRLKEISEKTYSEIFADRQGLHFHEVDWSKTTEKNGFPSRTANDLLPYQIQLKGINNQKARIFGAYYQNIFYVVWFDFHHQIWPSFKKHT